MTFSRLRALLLLGGALVGCSGDQGQPTEGSFSILTYNVAGLPQGLSGSNPELNIPRISPRLNDFDLVLVQEDFWYHDELSAEVTLPYQSEPWSDRPDLLDIGDGLNRFSIFPFTEPERSPWPGCNGTTDCASDCLARKGFRVAAHEIAPGVEVLVFNLHMEAGGCEEDLVIREDSVDLLLERLEAVTGPVILAGDWNLHADDPVDGALLERLYGEGGLTDACLAVGCEEDHIDRVLTRGTAEVELTIEGWWVPEGWVDEAGVDLSDHEPVAAVVGYQRD